MVDQVLLRPHHVADSDHGKAEGVVVAGGRIDGGGPCGTGATAEDIDANNEVDIGVDGLARPYHGVPPARAGVAFAEIARHV